MTAFAGDILTTTAAPVTANPTSTRTWSWLRNGTAIAGQTSTTYRVTDADVGSAVWSRQTETNFVGSTIASATPLNILSWSPASLFTASEPGVWLDPSDVANLDWRRNLLTWTQDFDNAAWTKGGSTITVNATTAPDGSLAADKVVETATTSTHGINPATFTFAATTAYTASIYVKAAERTWAYMQFASAPFVPNTRAWFNLSDGTTSQVQNSTATITSVGNGWYRCTLSATSVAGGVSTTPLVVGASTGTGISSYAGDDTSGVFMWGAQLEIGSAATTYQPIITTLEAATDERFPNATMFQDRAGSTLVTTPGQSVGLRLDKSQGLVLGPQWVPDPNFDNAASWLIAAGWDVSGGVATATSAGTATQVQIPAGTRPVPAVGSVAEITLVVDSVTAGGFAILYSGALGPTITTPGTYTYRLVATSTAGNIGVRAIGTTSGTISYLSAREIAGNHAVASNAGSEGRYGIEPFVGTRNLLTYTEEFDNAVWIKGVSGTASAPVVTPNAATAPDGTMTADLVQLRLNGATDGSFSWLYQNLAVPSGATRAMSVYVKAAIAGDVGKTIRLSGTVVTAVTLTADWQRVSNSALLVTGATISFGVRLRGTDATSDSVDLHIWGGQVDDGATATAYQRVVDQYNVTQAGVPSIHYVQYDGTDSFFTPTITPGIDKIQFFAGVRKLDNTVGTIAELGAASGSGLAALYTNSSNNYGLLSRGTIQATTVSPSGATVPPITNVLTGLGDISGDTATLRINGTQVSQSTDDQGTGDYLANPIYIGRRASSLLPLVGRDYGIVVRFGANLSTSNINRAEYYMAQKTGVTL